jgi:hypothetical protein
MKSNVYSLTKFCPKKNEYNLPLSIFLISGTRTRKMFTLMVIIHNLLQFYLKQNKDLDPSKEAILK